MDLFSLFDWNKFISFIKSDEFIFYGIFIYYFIFPFFMLILGSIISFIFDYSEFRLWKNEKK